MGVKRRREEECSEQPPRVPPCTSTLWTTESLPEDHSQHDMKCSSCCNNYQIIKENDELIENERGSEMRPFNISFSRFSDFLLSRRRDKILGPIILLIIVIASSSIVQVESVCVWQGGKGLKVACGFRQSGLFRLRSLGGIKGYVGAGFTIGDEDGFKDSLTNTEGQQQPPQQGDYLNPNVHTQRSLVANGAQNGLVGQYSHINEQFLPQPNGNPASQQKLQYMNNLQDQMAREQLNLENQASDQQNQKMLEQQLYIQGLVPPPVPTPKVKRAGGLTKRASLWNWPQNIFGRGKNGGPNGKSKKKPKHQEFDGPPPPQHQHGPPPHNRRNGPPHKNKPSPRWDRPGKNGGPPRDHGGRRGPPRPPKPDSFANHQMKNPFSHLHDNFAGKQSPDMRKMKFPHDQHFANKNFAAENKQFPQMHQSNEHFQQQRPGGGNQLPQTLMMPPAPSPSIPAELPKFKKIPSNLSSRPDDYDDGPGNMENQQQRPTQHTAMDRMMPPERNDGPSPQMDYYSSPEQQFHPPARPTAHDPAGLQLLKQTENFGTLFHLVNPDGNPVNMQFERQPVLPPGLDFSSQQQQDIAEELLMQNANMDGGDQYGGVGLEGGADDSALANAVYDPNVFPDIYFTTTEKHHQQQQPGLLQNHNMLPGGYPSISQELLDNPLLQTNQIKRVGSGEASQKKSKKKIYLKSTEQNDASTEIPVAPRRKMRRRKKFRVSNNVDTSESDTTGPEAGLPKRRRKGRRKKYKLQTAKNDVEYMGSSTERMGIAAGGEQTSFEQMKTESPTADPLTTTPSPDLDYQVASSSENSIKSSTEKTKNKSGEIKLIKLKSKSGDKSKTKTKTSFSLPSNEDPYQESASPSSENKIDVTTTTNRTSTEETTTKLPFSYSTFGYFDAVKENNNRYNNNDDYDGGYSGGPGDYFRDSYDPRYPPDHEINRGQTSNGHNMSKFIRPRGPYTQSSTTTNSPFILYDMMGTRNQSRFSSKFHKDNSHFRLDEDEQEVGRVGNPDTGGLDTFHPFYANSNFNKDDKGIYMKFDSREWPSDKNPKYQKQPDAFSNHYNRSFSSGYYGGSKEFRPSMEVPSSLMDWEKRLSLPSFSTVPPASSIFPGSTELKTKGSSIEMHVFGPPDEKFGPVRSTTTPFTLRESSESKKKLHQNLFGGSSADVSDAGNWASPNYWGTVQQSDRYAPQVDYDGNNLKRLLEFGDPNGLKEMAAVDLSSPTPLPIPSPSPGQNTMEDDGPDYYLSPSTPGSRWGKQRRRKKPTPEPTTPTPLPIMSIISSVGTTVRAPTAAAMVSTTASPPAKWLAVMSNEVDIPSEYYDPLEPIPNAEKKKGKGKKKSGIEIKFKSGEERDPEEEEEKEQQTSVPKGEFSNIPPGTGASGYPGVMVHNFDASQGYTFGDVGRKGFGGHPPPPPPPDQPGSSEMSYYPMVHNNDKGAPVSSGPTGLPSSILFPPFGGPSGSNNPSGPAFPDREDPSRRNNFIPSAEDISRVEGPPPSGNGGGVPSHIDNPFKMFEKHKPHGGSGMGFVSTNNEFKAMENQINHFSTNPERFLQKDSPEGNRGHGPPYGDQPGFRGSSAPQPPQGAPPTGFLNIPLPSMERSPGDPMLHAGQGPPSGYGNDFRDSEKGSYAPGPPPGEGYPPSGVSNALPPGGLKPEGWEYKGGDNNDVTNEIFPPHQRPLELTTRHPILHLDLAGPPQAERRPPQITGPSEEDMRRPPPPGERRPQMFGPSEEDFKRPPPQGERRPPPQSGPSEEDLRRPPPPQGERRPPQMAPSEEDYLRPPPFLREDHMGPPPGHMRHPPPREDHPRGPPPPREDHPRGPPPPREDHPRGPPPPREDHPRGPPPPREDHPRGPPPPREDHPRGPPPPREDHPRGPPPSFNDDRGNRGPPPHIRDEHRPPPPHLRDNHRPPPPHGRDDHRLPPFLRGEDHRPPHLRGGDERRPPPPHVRDDHKPPPFRDDHKPPPFRDDHKPPPFRDDHKPPPFRDDHRGPPSQDRPPPHHRDHEGPPGRPHDFPPRGPPQNRPPGPPREQDRRPPHERGESGFERDFPPPPHPPRAEGPPRPVPNDKNRDGTQHHGPHHSPPRFEDGPFSGPTANGGHFYPPSMEDSDRFNKDRRNFDDKHKVIENLRPPAPNKQFRDPGHENHGDHSSFGTWQDDNTNQGMPPIPQGMPKFVDIQKVPKKHHEIPPKSNKPQGNPFLQKHPPHPGGKKPAPTKVPHQIFKPPPPPKQKGNFLTNLLTGPGPFGKSHGKPPPPPPANKPRPPQQQLPPPPHNLQPRPHGPPRPPFFPNSEQISDEFAAFQDQFTKPNNPNNYVNAFNDRYQPPPHGQEPNKIKTHLQPPPPPKQKKSEQGAPLPFHPFPPDNFESAFVDLDKNPHASMIPPTLLPVPSGDGSLPVREMHKTDQPRPVYKPKASEKPGDPKAKDEKSKLFEAFETLNNAKYDVIQSMAADKFGPEFIDKLKTKTNIMQNGHPHLNKPMFPLKVETLPVITSSSTPAPKPLFQMFASLTTQKPYVQGDTSKLAELMKMINNHNHSQFSPAASTMVAGNLPEQLSQPSNPISALLQSLTKPAPGRTGSEVPSNPGLLSLTSTLNKASSTDIKSLQAQIAKAIIAKAHRKQQLQLQQPSEQLEKPFYQPLQISASTNESPLKVLQQLAQNRQASIQAAASANNYSASQIETLKKLIALNNIEQRLTGPAAPFQVSNPSEATNDPLKKLQALLPAALTGAKPDQLSTNAITRKMLDSSTANAMHHFNNNLQSQDPTLLALKAIALSKAQGVNPQPSISFPQQAKPTEPSSQPIAVDLSAILSPSPPVVEVNRKRRLTNVRNAPKSFFPANATQGFEEFSFPLISEFHCDAQSFFPGLYADAELGCRVFHLCAKTDAGYMMKSFRCPKETVFDQEVLRCNWNLFVDCPASKNKYHFNKYLSQSFQFLKILGEFSANYQKDATMTG